MSLSLAHKSFLAAGIGLVRPPFAALGLCCQGLGQMVGLLFESTKQGVHIVVIPTTRVAGKPVSAPGSLNALLSIILVPNE